MRLLILSDLHLSSHPVFQPIHNGQRIDNDADVVVLAGDIEEGTAGFQWARATFPDKPIVMVAGNHEFYGFNWTTHIDHMREAARKHDIEYLEADGIDIAGIRFLGCTLWTDFALFGEEKRNMAMLMSKALINDHQYIQISRYAETYWAKSKIQNPDP